MWKVQVSVGGREVAATELAVGSAAVLGRDPTADLVVAERSVSRRHCRLSSGLDGVKVEDLGSANGIVVQGQPVVEVLLQGAAEARIGMATIRISRSTAQTGMIPVQGIFAPEQPEETRVGMRPGSEGSVREASTSAYKGFDEERLAMLIETSKSLSSSLDLDTTLDLIMDHLFQIRGVKRGVLALLEDDGRLVARVIRPEVDARELSEVCSQQIIRQVMQTGRAEIIDDASLMTGLNQAQSILASNIKAAICAPLISRQRCLGALYADCPGKARLYDELDKEFFGAFAGIAAISLENSRMLSELKERERLQRDLEIAAEIQKGLLPVQDFAHPGLDVDWVYLPSKVVGGDFCDCVTMDEDRVAVVIGDVSGKSIGAALFMARLMSFLRAMMPEDPSPGAVLTRTNALLGTRADTVLFATALYILIDPKARRLRYASAGHNPGLILDQGCDEFRELPRTGMPMGIVEESAYVGVEEAFDSGSLLVLYTDGIVEARDREGRQFGFEATKRLILEHRDREPQDITRVLRTAVEDHCQGSPYVRDDIALVVVRATG